MPHHNAGMDHNWATTKTAHTPERPAPCAPPQRRHGPQQTSHTHIHTHLRGKYSVPHHNAGMDHNERHTHTHTHTPKRQVICIPPQRRQNFHLAAHLRGQHSVSHDAGFTFRGAEGHVTQVDDASQAVLSIPHPNAVQVKKYEETRCLLQ